MGGALFASSRLAALARHGEVQLFAGGGNHLGPGLRRRTVREAGDDAAAGGHSLLRYGASCAERPQAGGLRGPGKDGGEMTLSAAFWRAA